MLKIVVAGCALLSLTACAGRAPQLPPLIHAADPQLSCTQIDAEASLNAHRISALETEKGWKMGQNAVAGVVGFMAWPAWLALDFQNAAGQEAAALTQRNDYLLAMKRDRCTIGTQTAKIAAEPSPRSALASNDEIAASLLGR